MADPIRILIADDHAILRAGVRALLDRESDMEVVGEASTGTEALNKIRECRPDVTVMDLSMPDLGGLGVIRRVAALELDTRIVVLTMHGEEDYLLDVVDAGASGFVRKSCADRDLVEAIRSAARGEVFLSGHATKLVLQRYRALESGEIVPPLDRLSPREREVLSLTAEGYTASEIGDQLFLSPKTVETYRSRVAQKLGLRGRPDLIHFALRTGLLKSE